MRRVFSLRTWLIGILVVCWFLPIAAILAVSGYLITGGLRDRIRATAETSVQNALVQSENRLSAAMDASRASSYDATVKMAWEDYQASGDAVALYDEITAYLTGKYAYDDTFRATALFFIDAPLPIYYAHNRSTPGAASEYRNFMDNVYETARTQADTLGTGIGFFTWDGTLYMVRNIVDSSFTPYAVIVMACSAQVLFESVGNIVWLSGASVSVDDLPCADFDAGADLSAADGTMHLGGGRYLVSAAGSVSGHAIRIAAESDGSLLTDELARALSLMGLVVLGVAPLILLALGAFGRQVTAPVNALIDASRRVEAGSRGYTLAEKPGNREFRDLTEHFNSMSRQLKYQFDRSYEEQLALQDARIKALQSQINPHFLNNTLETINWEARMAGDAKVSRMIEALSELLDAATARGGNPDGTVAEELRYADAYLYIISERFGDRLTVHREIDEGLLGLTVPRLILQPIVENAVEHGIAQLPRGELCLRVRAETDGAVLEVEHDGIMTDADREAIARLLAPDDDDSYPARTGGRVGIRNVNRRLRLLRGDRSGLTITEVAPGRVLARIFVPNRQESPVRL